LAWQTSAIAQLEMKTLAGFFCLLRLDSLICWVAALLVAGCNPQIVSNHITSLFFLFFFFGRRKQTRRKGQTRYDKQVKTGPVPTIFTSAATIDNIDGFRSCIPSSVLPLVECIHDKKSDCNKDMRGHIVSSSHSSIV
jgi:hypothetical protein